MAVAHHCTGNCARRVDVANLISLHASTLAVAEEWNEERKDEVSEGPLFLLPFFLPSHRRFLSLDMSRNEPFVWINCAGSIEMGGTKFLYKGKHKYAPRIYDKCGDSIKRHRIPVRVCRPSIPF